MKTPLTLLLALAVGVSSACASDAARTRYISHRGESLDAPENTMAAFRLAVDRGSDGFECDVYRTADNEIVCIHDATTTRTTGTNLTVAASTLAQLRALDAGSWKGAAFAGERIPTLAEAISLARDDFEIYVEIKCGTEILPRLTEVLAAEPKATPERVVFIAFSTNVIKTLRQQLPDYRAYWLSSLSTNASGALTPSAASAVATLQASGANGVDASAHTALDSVYVEVVENAGYSFHVWTVNSVARAAGLAAMGVDTVTSDCGAALVAALVPAKDPVIRWTFDGGAATNCGSGGMGYDATLVGTPSFTNGIDGQGLRLDGDDYARVAYPLPAQGSITLWFKPDFFYNFNTVFDNSVHADQWEMWLYGDGRLRGRVNNDGSGDVEYDLDNLNGSNHWYHIAFVWNNAGTPVARLYVNGVECKSDPITTWVAPGSTFYIGGGNNSKAKGIMDDVRIYDVALTAAQVQSVQSEVAAQSPAVHLRLDGEATNAGTGGARYDATLNGAPVWSNGWNDKGQALALDGVDDVVSVPYRLPASGTVALWYYVPGPWFSYNTVFDNAAHANHYECWIDGSGMIVFRPAGDTWPQQAQYALDGASNRWHHVVGTWDALSSNMVLYVDGVERSRAVNTTGAAWPLAGTNFYVGGGNAGNSRGRGLASDLQIFETPLSASRVAELYGEFGRRGGLVAYLPFDGTAADVAGSNAVVVTGAASFSRGKLGQGLSYKPAVTPGSGGSCVSVSNALGASVGTLAMWFYARGPWYNYHPVMDNSVNGDWWESWIYEDGRFAIRVSNLPGGGMVTYDLDNLRGSNAWYHIAFTWDRAAQQAKLYVDGLLRTTAALAETGWVNPDATLRIGSYNAGNKAANGVWDEVRVYDRALTAEEIPALMALPQRVTGTLLRIL